MSSPYDVVKGNVVYILLVLAILAIGSVYIADLRNAGGVYEAMYSQELARAINYAHPGASICLDVTRGSEIAITNGIPVNQIIRIDNVANQVRVTMNSGSGTVASFFNDVNVVEGRIVFPSGGETTNRYCFEIEETLERQVT